MDEQGRLSKRLPSYLTNNEGTDVPRAMTYTENRAPGFQDLSLNPFFQEEQQPVQANDRPAQPRQATPKAAPQQTDAY